MSRLAVLALTASLLLLAAAPPGSTTVRIRQLRTQKVGDHTYFFVILRHPPGSGWPEPEKLGNNSPLLIAPRHLPRYPRLFALDVPAQIHLDLDSPQNWLEPREEPESRYLWFAGRVAGDKVPTRARLEFALSHKDRKSATPPRRLTADFALDWSKAVASEPRPKTRKADPDWQDDIEGRWAQSRALWMTAAGWRCPDDGYPFFAAAAIQNTFGVSVAPPDQLAAPRDTLTSALGGGYEMLTGGTAITESLAMKRLDRRAVAPDQKRSLFIENIQGVTIAQHPWERMMQGKKPAAEPLAKLVPHDNYYFTVHSLDAFTRAWDLIDLWGGSVLRPVRLSGRDYRLRSRYETQLCLPATELAKVLKPEQFRCGAVTGHDISWQEGSDVTVLFDLADRKAFLAAHDQFIDASRKAHGKAFSERSTKAGDVAVTSYTTPRREVSLHRAELGDVVICSNSLAALRRVLDVKAGKIDPLAESLDFQYMRTVFVRDTRHEDGFVFLSDAFVRSLVGPATMIKAVRRVQARSALAALSYSVLAMGGLTGKLPTTGAEAMKGVGLDSEALAGPAGESVAWDAQRGQAVCEVYGTLAFSTPLVELPIDRVSESERAVYDSFRADYERLWQRFFDPVGMRFTLSGKQAVLDTYILPLINSSQYNDLRTFTGQKTARYDPTRLPDTTFLHLLASTPDTLKQFVPGMGNQVSLHIDTEALDLDTPLQALLLFEEHGPQGEQLGAFDKWVRTVPLTVGIAIADEDELERTMRKACEDFLGGWKVTSSKHGKVTIQKAAPPEGEQRATVLGDIRPPALYQATLEGVYYLSFSEAALKRRIDTVEAKKGKARNPIDVNAAMSLRLPRGKTGAPLRKLAELITREQALAASVGWKALYDAKMVTSSQSRAEREATALRVFGYVPSSPDGAAFRHEALTGDIVNARHGTIVAPRLNDRLAPESPLAQLFDVLDGIRIDLRFREDGIHTVLTLDLGAK